MGTKIERMQPVGATASRFAGKIAQLKAASGQIGATCQRDGYEADPDYMDAIRTYEASGTGIKSKEEERLESHGIYKRFWPVNAAYIEKRGVPAENAKAWLAVKTYIKNLDRHIRQGEGLTLVGGVGTMKTTMAIAVLRELVDRRQVGYFIPMVSLLDNLNQMRERRDGSLTQLEIRIRTTPLLVLDDLGAEYDHTWVQCKVDAIIAERYNRMRATIVTSNLAAKDIKDRYQLRIYDRLRATNKIITFKGASKRESWG